MTLRERRQPTVEQLWVAPELASLAILDAALAASILAIRAVYPEMQDQDPADQTDSLLAATIVLDNARGLAASIARYRLILCRPRDRAEDTPF
jgi:hypothetical protein